MYTNAISVEIQKYEFYYIMDLNIGLVAQTRVLEEKSRFRQKMR